MSLCNSNNCCESLPNNHVRSTDYYGKGINTDIETIVQYK